MSTAAPPAQPGHARGLTRAVLSTVPVLGAAAFLLLVGIPGSPTQSLRIVTSSMSPTLRPGDHVLVSHVGRGGDAWRRGDVVVLDLGPGPLVIKRIVGLPGDVVALRDGRLWRNGQEVDEPWSDPGLHRQRLLRAGAGAGRQRAASSVTTGVSPGTHATSGRCRWVTSTRRVVAVLWPPSRAGEQP